jgi:tripartite-type tricarboxylate transporter receptor subunit TctC
MMLPAGTPGPVLRVLHEGTVKALRSKEVSGRLSNEAAEVIANTPQEFAVFLKAESEKWTGVIRKAKVRLSE